MVTPASLVLDQLNSSRSSLDLDDQSINPRELSLSTLMRELNLQNRPSWLLCRLMNILEQKRQAQGLGWSRPWNKTGLTVFRTHTQKVADDVDYFAPVFAVLGRLLPHAPLAYQAFAAELLIDPSLMAFTFYHNRQTDGAQYEGLTLSLGRKVTGDPSKRDRLDLILEDQRDGGRVDGTVDLLRLYVCPWSEYQDGRRHHLLEARELSTEDRADVQALYENCVAAYHIWKNDDRRQWSHWSANYIDYFGSRSFIPIGTAFH